jgi:hypothetical protein
VVRRAHPTQAQAGKPVPPIHQNFLDWFLMGLWPTRNF